MDELLASVLDAHGGLESSTTVTKLTARLSLGGPFWAARGWPGVYADQTVTLDTHREHITFAPFTAPDPVTTPWDPIQVAYFTSAAVWNYLTEPFGFTYSGVDAREIEPRDEHGQRWRRLAVTFPRTNANHNPEHVFYFDESFMQRRMDYSPHVTGNPPVAHYMHDPKAFDGFVFPTRRLVHRRDTDGNTDQTVAGITIDIDTIMLERW
jgi:hypothetical protein